MTSSPTPAVLPDVRALVTDDTPCVCCCRTKAEHNAKGQCPETSYFVANLPATPPASDAAVPAGENDDPCEGGAHCCCCGPYDPCCDCGQVMPGKACFGERCWCGAPAAKKVGEEVLFDDPNPARHNLTAYVCAAHYAQMMGSQGAAQVGVEAAAAPKVASACDQCNGHGYLVMAPSTCSAGGERMACPKCQGGTPIENKDGSWSGKVNISTDVAPKVASGTGAGLRERVARKLCEQHGGDPDAIAKEEHDCWDGPLWGAFVKDADDIIALATPTDAKDGATGGGEVEHLFDRRHAISSPEYGGEPSLRQMVRFYYGQHGQIDPDADTAAYFTALNSASEHLLERMVALAEQALKPAGDGGEAQGDVR